MGSEATATVRVIQTRPTGRWFYIGMSLATIAVVVLGFAPSLIGAGARNGPVTPLVAVHGAIAVTWLLVFLAQTTLVATHRLAIHRRLGVVAGFVAAALVISGYMTAMAMARRGIDLSGDLHIQNDPLLGIVNPVGDLVPFVVLLSAGYWYRHFDDVHKRLMLLATVGGLMPAPLAHAIGHVPTLVSNPPIIMIPLVLLYFASAAYDRIMIGRIHPVSLWVAAAILGWDTLLNAVIGPSAAWHRFAQWLIS